MRSILLFVLLLAPTLALPHGGGLNAEGCHNNRKTGDYHCHRAPSYERSNAQRAPAPSLPAPSRLSPNSQGRSTTVPNGDGPT